MALVCPRELNEITVPEFLRRLRLHAEEPTSPTATIDFSQIYWARPYGTLLLAEGVRSFVADRKARGLRTRAEQYGLFRGGQSSAVSYLSHMGFFQYIGLNLGNTPGAAPGSRTYMPITVLSRADLASETDCRHLIQDTIDRKSRKLAAMVFDDESQQDMIGYCFREVIRNVFEHAETDECVVMAQKYSAAEVEIAIADRGVGVAATLSDSYSFATVEDALRAAIQPGVSRVHGSQDRGRWDNSGFGLFVLSELGRTSGAFTLTSSGYSLRLTSEDELITDVPCPGTAVMLRVNVSDAEYFPNRLHQIVDRGEQLQQQLGIEPRAASKSTRMSGRSGPE
jgi:hypothetical protein